MQAENTSTLMTATERADAIIKDLIVNHLPRIQEGLKVGYVDENQILIAYDHAVRARILKEISMTHEKEGLPLSVTRRDRLHRKRG